MNPAAPRARRPVRWALLGAVAAAGACSGGREPQQAAQHAPAPVVVRPAADVPALLAASVDELRRRLGGPRPVPSEAVGPILAALGTPGTALRPDSMVAFRPAGLVVVATYNPRTRRVDDLLLLGRHEDSLMARASLRPDDPRYLLLPVFEPHHPGQIVGLRVVAK